jgi:hypothetical protein
MVALIGRPETQSWSLLFGLTQHYLRRPPTTQGYLRMGQSSGARMITAVPMVLQDRAPELLACHCMSSGGCPVEIQSDRLCLLYLSITLCVFFSSVHHVLTFAYDHGRLVHAIL